MTTTSGRYRIRREVRAGSIRGRNRSRSAARLVETAGQGEGGSVPRRLAERRQGAQQDGERYGELGRRQGVVGHRVCEEGEDEREDVGTHGARCGPVRPGERGED